MDFLPKRLVQQWSSEALQLICEQWMTVRSEDKLFDRSTVRWTHIAEFNEETPELSQQSAGSVPLPAPTLTSWLTLPWCHDYMISLSLKLVRRRDVVWSQWVFCLMPPPSLSKSTCTMKWSRALGRYKMKRPFGFLLSWSLLQVFSHMGACQLKKKGECEWGRVAGEW